MTVWTEDSIRALIQTNDKAVIRALQALWEYQTYAEQNIGEAVEDNRVGYNKPDSKTAKFYINILNGPNPKLGSWQIRKLRQMLIKYTKQLTKIANVRELIKCQKQTIL